ncbi:MAG: hypothetical protein KAI55_02450, partial [Candidatus Aenigmarchaeota archaeon]|nr:hypothetical protein [Candidatus Aenigmarchaeota archaeon]
MSRFSDVIEKMKIKKKETDNTRKKETRTIFQLIELMKKAAILKEKKRKEKLMKDFAPNGGYPPPKPKKELDNKKE